MGDEQSCSIETKDDVIIVLEIPKEEVVLESKEEIIVLEVNKEETIVEIVNQDTLILEVGVQGLNTRVY